jgi:hypothetical protein
LPGKRSGLPIDFPFGIDGYDLPVEDGADPARPVIAGR